MLFNVIWPKIRATLCMCVCSQCDRQKKTPLSYFCHALPTKNNCSYTIVHTIHVRRRVREMFTPSDSLPSKSFRGQIFLMYFFDYVLDHPYSPRRSCPPPPERWPVHMYGTHTEKEKERKKERKRERERKKERKREKERERERENTFHGKGNLNPLCL